MEAGPEVVVRTREIEDEDLVRCAQVYAEVYNGVPWNESWDCAEALARLREIQGTPGFHGVVAIESDVGEVLGFALGHVLAWYGGSKHFYLREVCVEASHQRRGIGTAIMQALSRDLIAMGVEKVTLLASVDTPAADFYRGCGFSVNPKMVMMLKNLGDAS